MDKIRDDNGPEYGRHPATTPPTRKRSSSGPLSGRRILVTRTSEGNKLERVKLESLGAEVFELATIKIVPPTSWEAIDQAIARISDFEWIVFTSANGVREFFKRLKKVLDSAHFPLGEPGEKRDRPRFACVGPSTERALKDQGYASDYVPKQHFLTSNLGAELTKYANLRGRRVLLARAEGASEEIVEILKESGAIVVEAPVYATDVANDGSQLPEGVFASLTDLTVTSPSTVEGLLALLPAERIKSSKILVHCIGPVTERAARAAGVEVASVATVHTIDGLVQSMVERVSRDRYRHD